MVSGGEIDDSEKKHFMFNMWHIFDHNVLQVYEHHQMIISYIVVKKIT
jgi:hypothetical protein